MTENTFRLDHRTLSKQEINEVAVVASRAFYTDPFFRFLSPKAYLRSRGVTLFFRANLRHWAGGHIVTVRNQSDHIVGAAAWLPPGAYPQGVGVQLAQVPGTIRALYRRLAALSLGTSFLNAIAKKHPHQPHWYLFLLVTDPEYQRRGIGSLLMNDALPRIDADGVIAYLETQKEDNLAYYRRFGFDVVTTLTPVENGPPLYAMQRPSR